MKKNNNIKQLKEMVNNNVLETVETVAFGVQAYNISANEYEVITKFAKINGRYYFIDRDGNKYLASRYDRAELVARDILDNLEYARQTAYEDVCTLEEKKQVFVNGAYLSLFLDFCDLFGFEVESVENHFHNNGEMYTVYRLKSEETAKDDAQSEETEADEQDGEETEDNENGENAAACEAFKLSGILAKMKNGARKVCEKIATVAFFAGAVTAAFLALYVAIVGLTALLGVCGIEGGSWEAIALSVLLLFTVIMDFCVFIELNTMALLSKLFKVENFDGRIMRFTRPFSVMYQLIKQSKE